MASRASWPIPPCVARDRSTRTFNSALTAVFSIVVTAGVLLAGSTAAHAEPSVAQLEKQIDEAWHKLEPIIERHNAVSIDLKAKKKEADALQKKIRPLELQVDLAMTRVGEFAAQSYKRGNASPLNAILSGGSPTDFADRLALLNEFAKDQHESIAEVLALKTRYDEQKAPLDKLVAQLARTESDLAKQKKEIDAEVERLQKLRIKAYGSSGITGTLRPAPCPYEYLNDRGGRAANFACRQIGKPYVWASAGPSSYDCSGLTMAAWASVGVSLPHNALRQSQTIRSVTRAQLRAGDLVFFNSSVSHVGIYVGGGWIVHAPSSGDKVRMRKVTVGNIHGYGRPG